MRFDTSQQMKLGQHMKLAPRMIQSMEILQLPTLALEERIAQELESNITLETVEPAAAAEDVRAEMEEARRDEQAGERELQIDETGSQDFERLESWESSYGEASENEYSAASARPWEERDRGRPSSRLAGERDAKMDAMANTAARGPSLTEQLQEQWSWVDTNERTRAIGETIVGLIDSDGYLRADLDSVADEAGEALGERPSHDEVDTTLREVQRALEPAGLAARDTRECLLLQIDAVSEQRPGTDLSLVRALISEHLDDLAQNRLPRIAEEREVDIERIKEAMAWMSRLTVAPGRALASESPPVIVPDAAIEYDDEEDRYIPRLIDGRLPTLRINPSYARMAKDKSTEKPTRDFLRTNLTNAQWLIDAVGQRNHTLLRVLNVVAEAQREFFEQGPQALKPLPMTQVADQLGVHVATVSRAVAGKWIETPRGVQPLRRFFSGGTQTEAGEDVSWEAVKAALREVVDSEDKSKPLSDDALADELKKRGVEIARRTVAKYRSQLGIPSARIRKQY